MTSTAHHAPLNILGTTPQPLLRGYRQIDHLELGFRQCSFNHTSLTLPGTPYNGFRGYGLFQPCYVSLPLSRDQALSGQSKAGGYRTFQPS